MMVKKLETSALLALLAWQLQAKALENPLHLQLANALPISELNHWQGDLSGYDFAEKLDGVRALWDGKNLKTRSNRLLPIPQNWRQALPDFAVEGELWLGRGRFAEVVGIVNSDDLSRWQNVKLVLFDVPYHSGSSAARYRILQDLIAKSGADFLRLATRSPVGDKKSLQQALLAVEKQGGEGLMLYRRAALYHATRSDDLIKLKSHRDAEARVLAHIGGKGKYQNMLGALLVVDANGREFKIGSGFSDQERRQPPPVGALITYRYSGLTKNQKPRFARFVREVKSR